VAAQRQRIGPEPTRLEATRLKPQQRISLSLRDSRIQLAAIILLFLIFEAAVVCFSMIYASPTSSSCIAQKPFAGLMAIGAGIAGIIVTGIGIWKMAIRPLNIVRAAMEYFAEGRSEQRLYYPDAEDNLGMTLQAINMLLDRQDEAMEHQRRFVGSVSHDIRTPLTIMRGDIEVALVRDRTPAEYKQVLKSNLEEVERINILIEDLLTLARSDTGELGLRLRPVSISNLLNDVRKAYLAQAEAQGLKLNLYIEHEVMIEGDPDRLRQLFNNLVENALHYTPKGGKIGLLVMREENAARVVVRDTGLGIPPKDLAHIFEPFYRGMQQKKNGHHGYGLGLAICKLIVQAHGGKIFVESLVGPGSGTSFTILLPSIITNRVLKPVEGKP
jgi:signal transduction histidine kinase